MKALALSLAFVLLAALPQRWILRFHEDVTRTMWALGSDGSWQGCVYGWSRADSITIAVMMPRMAWGCPTLGSDSVRAIGLLVPRSGRSCEFLREDERDYLLSGLRYRIHWCGGQQMRVMQSVPAPASRIGA